MRKPGFRRVDWPPVLAADDVINLMAEPGISFVNPAVFATLLRPPGDFVAKRLVDVTAHG